jgi:hypothetical protein
VFVGMARETGVKKVLKESFAKAKAEVEERKKPKEPPKPEAKPAAPPVDKPAGQTEPPKGNEPPKPEPPPQPKPEPTPEPKPEPKPGEQQQPPAAATGQQPPRRDERKDPNVEVLADLLEGKRRAVMQIDSAADLLQWFHACGEELAFPRAVAVARHDANAGTFDQVVDQLKKLAAPVLLPAELSSRPRTRYQTNPARILHDAGIEVGFVVGEHGSAVRGLFYQLMELVRAGLPADVALRGVTATPAKMLGLEAQAGSLKAGLRADLLVFSGDPLDPVSELRSVWLRGQRVPPKTP